MFARRIYGAHLLGLCAGFVLAAAAWGLGLLWRNYRAEVAVCVAITGIFLLLNCGYFLPYGGTHYGLTGYRALMEQITTLFELAFEPPGLYALDETTVRQQDGRQPEAGSSG